MPNSGSSWKPVAAPGGAPSHPFFSAATRAGDFVFASGVIGVLPGSPTEVDGVWSPGALVEGGIVEQTRQSMRNLEATLVAAGAGLHDIVKVSAFLCQKDRDFDAFNRAYQEFFPDTPPARTAVQARIFGDDVLVEIDCIAYLPSRED